MLFPVHFDYLNSLLPAHDDRAGPLPIDAEHVAVAETEGARYLHMSVREPRLGKRHALCPMEEDTHEVSGEGRNRPGTLLVEPDAQPGGCQLRVPRFEPGIVEVVSHPLRQPADSRRPDQQSTESVTSARQTAGISAWVIGIIGLVTVDALRELRNQT